MSRYGTRTECAAWKLKPDPLPAEQKKRTGRAECSGEVCLRIKRLILPSDREGAEVVKEFRLNNGGRCCRLIYG